MSKRKQLGQTTIYTLHSTHLKRIEETGDVQAAKEAEIEYLLSTGNVLFDYHAQRDLSVPDSQSIDDIMTTRIQEEQLLQRYIATTGAVGSTCVVDVRCEACQSSDVVINNDDMMLHCLSCNIVSSVAIDINMMHTLRAGTPPQTSSETNYTQAKRRAHLSEWLMSIQGHKSVDIPDRVYDHIYRELAKMRYITSDNIVVAEEKITDACIHGILKTAKLGKYYDSVAFIRSRITGTASAFLPAEVENKLKTLFDIIADSYEKFKRTPDGKTLTSYAFIIRKLLEKLGEYEHLGKFKLVKSKFKLNEYNIMWRNICKAHGWAYTASY